MFTIVQLYTVCYKITNDNCYNMQKMAIFLIAVIIMETLMVTQCRPIDPDTTKGEDGLQKSKDPTGVLHDKEGEDGSLAYVFKSENPKGGECSYSFNSDDNELEHQRDRSNMEYTVKHSAFWHCCNCFLRSVRCCCCPIVFCAEILPDDALSRWCSKNFH
ncbi:uncharacterized protein LOC126843039 isoform X1 [Adelges cooleyi]|uniref:uncharacterized protein LOC126843039 isoform X1 n=1 Tax=Adelges cooleyi TaxID=133065 RepID=UPI0021801A31|nr:uncharacterized protein LOC126843039 isoform X1 [Adelges cooleyi]